MVNVDYWVSVEGIVYHIVCFICSVILVFVEDKSFIVVFVHGMPDPHLKMRCYFIEVDMFKVLEEPIRQIAQNAGIDGAVVVQKVKETDGGFGFNAETLKYEDLMESGIVDPTKVVRSALQNASSAASMFLTTECVVGNLPEEKKENPVMPPVGY